MQSGELKSWIGELDYRCNASEAYTWKMRIVVVGGGKVGYYLTKTLLEHGHEPHLVETDREACTRIADAGKV